MATPAVRGRPDAPLPRHGTRVLGERSNHGGDVGRRRPRHLSASLAEDFRGWQGERTWHSLRHDLTLSAEHRSGGHVRVGWAISDGAPGEEWRFETSTWHEAGEDMRTLAADIRAFIASVAD
ncbi:DUF6228 family protein [Streptomyces werraensis]|uniref:DUF6228 family protein n=1 Tax=Streptomyces werraensis TaxID=68284 RepID=UPI0036F54B72